LDCILIIACHLSGTLVSKADFC